MNNCLSDFVDLAPGYLCSLCALSKKYIYDHKTSSVYACTFSADEIDLLPMHRSQDYWSRSELDYYYVHV